MKKRLVIMITLLMLFGVSCKAKKDIPLSNQEPLIEVNDVDRNNELYNKYIAVIEQFVVAYKQKDLKKIVALEQELNSLSDELSALDYSKLSEMQKEKLREAAIAFSNAAIEANISR